MIFSFPNIYASVDFIWKIKHLGWMLAYNWWIRHYSWTVNKNRCSYYKMLFGHTNTFTGFLKKAVLKNLYKISSQAYWNTQHNDPRD